jgi:hypothetical protein
MVVGCTGEDNLSAMARVGSAAVFHTESVSFVDADEELDCVCGTRNGDSGALDLLRNCFPSFPLRLTEAVDIM